MNFCPNCGAKKLRPQDKFCMNCGEPYPVLPQAEQEMPQAASPTDIEVAPAAVQPEPAQPTVQTIKEPSTAGTLQAEAPVQVTQAGPIQAPTAAAQAEPLPAAINTLQAQAEPDDTVQPLQEPAHQPPATWQEPAAEAPAVLPAAQLEAAPQRTAFDYEADAQAETRALQQSISEMLGVEPPQQAATANTQARQTEAAAYTAADNLFVVQPQQPAAGGGDAAADIYAQAIVNEAAVPAAGQEAAADIFVQQPEVEQLAQAFGNTQQYAAEEMYEQPQEQPKWQPIQGGTSLHALADEPPAKRLPEIALPDREPARKSGGAGRVVKIVLFVLLAILVFAVATIGATLGILYYKNSPSKAIDAFITALEDGDYTVLQSTVHMENLTGTTEGWDAFTTTFSTDAAKTALRTQLEAQAKNGAVTTDQYAAVQLSSEKLFLFVNRYYVEILPVDLLAVGYSDGEISLNGSYASGEETAEGLLYGGLMPGRYEYVLKLGGEEVLRGSIDAFAISAPNQLVANDGLAGTNTTATATVTVSNCLSDDAVIYVAGVRTEAQPSGGVVVLEDIAVGNEIHIIANVNGAQQEARVVFTDIAQTQLTFENYTTISAAISSSSEVEIVESTNVAENMTASDINTVLASYYRSYLTSINNQTTNTLENSTSANTAAMAERITSTNNAAYTFEYVGVNTDATSIVAGEEGGLPAVTFTATFSYRYTPRDGSAATEDGSNTQTVQIIYQDGQWRVNSMAFVTES